MTKSSEMLTFKVNPGNPGQFFACCGILEIANRLYEDAQGWFNKNGDEFYVNFHSLPNLDFLSALKKCELRNTMDQQQLDIRQQLREIKKKELTPRQLLQKKLLDKLWRERPLILEFPQPLRLDWYLDDRSGGGRFKTWAGQQSVIDIAQSMKQPIDDGAYDAVPPESWLQFSTGDELTFNFDSDASVQSSPLDVGFSLDPLKMSSASRPLLELLAFVGLQRFRPDNGLPNKTYPYTLWTAPLSVLPASTVCNGSADMADSLRFSFPLLFRTKYLKSFLPAQPLGEMK